MLLNGNAGRAESGVRTVFPGWMTSSVDPAQEWTHNSRYISQQILPRVYLGPLKLALHDREHVIIRQRVTHLVYVRDPTMHDFFPVSKLMPEFLQPGRLLAMDLRECEGTGETCAPKFNLAADWIRHTLAESESYRVLVCCISGVSAGPCVATAAVMALTGLSASLAIRWVLSRRLCVCMSERLHLQLREYEPIAAARAAMPVVSETQRGMQIAQRRAREDGDDGVSGPQVSASAGGIRRKHSRTDDEDKDT